VALVVVDIKLSGLIMNHIPCVIFFLICFYKKDKSSRPEHAEISSSLTTKKIIGGVFFFVSLGTWRNACACAFGIHSYPFIFFLFLVSVLEHGGQAALTRPQRHSTAIYFLFFIFCFYYQYWNMEGRQHCSGLIPKT
jgi:hypothetical protein